MLKNLLKTLACIALISPLCIAPALSQEEQIPSSYALRVYPLPGQLDRIPVFNSNSPEVVEEEGILLSTLPTTGQGDSPYQDFAFEGDFAVFSHHIAKDSESGKRLLYLGLLANNPSDRTVRVTIKGGASYLSQPDAIFRKDLDPLMNNTWGKVFAGPGDRVATELNLGHSQMPEATFVLPPNSTQLLYSHPIPTDVAIPPPINGRSTLMYLHSNGPVHLSQVARFADKVRGVFVQPTLNDYRELLNEGIMAGPRILEPTEFDPDSPPPKGSFEYGRVAGVSQGLTWKGRLFQGMDILQMPQPGQKVGFPIASLYLKRYGTAQNQSAQLLRRYPDSALQAHGNYGVRYQLEIPLHNGDPSYRTYALNLSTPAQVNGNAPNIEVTYLNPPNQAVMYRGSVRLTWKDEFNQIQDLSKHVVMRHGEEMPTLALITVPPGASYDVNLSLIYPADSTPPQLLTIERLE